MACGWIFPADGLWREDRHDFRESRLMRVVAIGAGIAGASAASQIPMAVHAAVEAVLIVAELSAVALCAESHRSSEVDRFSVGLLQSVVVLGIVTAQTALVSVLVMKPLVKLLQSRTRLGVEVWLAGIVTSGAGDHDGLAVGVLFTAVDQRVSSGCANRHREKGVGLDTIFNNAAWFDVIARDPGKGADKAESDDGNDAGKNYLPKSTSFTHGASAIEIDRRDPVDFLARKLPIDLVSSRKTERLFLIYGRVCRFFP